MSKHWLVMKRGLFYGPDNRGYTGIKDHAGRYSLEEARSSATCEGVSIIHEDQAPEFTSACFDDLARDHLTKQRDEARAERDQWHADACRLSSGLMAIRGAPESVPAEVLRGVAYDIALNCMNGDTAEYQIERRTALLKDAENQSSR
jgi:hypothetical protein